MTKIRIETDGERTKITEVESGLDLSNIVTKVEIWQSAGALAHARITFVDVDVRMVADIVYPQDFEG